MPPRDAESSPIIQALQRALRARRAVTGGPTNVAVAVASVQEYLDALRALNVQLYTTIPNVEGRLHQLERELHQATEGPPIPESEREVRRYQQDYTLSRPRY